MTEKHPVSRISLTTPLGEFIEQVCQAYRLDQLKEFKVIEVGYEDCNIIVDTDAGKFLAKIFAKTRSSTDIDRYVKIMESVLAAGVNHPEILALPDGGLVYQVARVRLVLMKFIEGNTFYELNRAPDDDELTAIIEQAARIHGVSHHPEYVHDSWAIPHIQKMYDRVKQYTNEEDGVLIESAITQYQSVRIDDLPHCLVHGDFTKTNVLKGNDGQIYILDFSVSNWYPRIQELAVICANLLYEPKHAMGLKERSRMAIEHYSKITKLTPEETAALPVFALAAVAMEYMGALQEKHINGNDTEETEYWLRLGLGSLREATSTP